MAKSLSYKRQKPQNIDSTKMDASNRALFLAQNHKELGLSPESLAAVESAFYGATEATKNQRISMIQNLSTHFGNDSELLGCVDDVSFEAHVNALLEGRDPKALYALDLQEFYPEAI